MLQLGRRLETVNKAIGFYSHALAALERNEFDVKLLDELTQPLPELADFSRSFLSLLSKSFFAGHNVPRWQTPAPSRPACFQAGTCWSVCSGYVDVQASCGRQRRRRRPLRFLLGR